MTFEKLIEDIKASPARVYVLPEHVLVDDLKTDPINITEWEYKEQIRRVEELTGRQVKKEEDGRWTATKR